MATILSDSNFKRSFLNEMIEFRFEGIGYWGRDPKYILLNP